MAWAINFEATGKVAIGDILYKLGPNGLLIPQPTDEEIVKKRISGYLKKIPDAAPAPAIETKAGDPFEVVVPPTGDKLPPPVAEDDDEVFGEPVVAPVVDLELMSLPALRELAKEKGFMGFKSATKEHLIRAIKGE